MKHLSRWNRFDLPTAAVVIVQNDPAVVLALSNNLHGHFAEVMVAENPLVLRTLLRHPKVQLAVLDLDLVNVEEVRQLASTCCNLTIVCTHRSPDDRMWIAALDAGAVELCHPADTRLIVGASRRLSKHHRAIGA